MIHMILTPLLLGYLTNPFTHVIIRVKAVEVGVVKPTQAELQQIFGRQA